MLEYGSYRRSRSPLAQLARLLHAPRTTPTFTLVMHACHIARVRLLSISLLVWWGSMRDRSAPAVSTLALSYSIWFAIDRIASFIDHGRPNCDADVLYYLRLSILTLAGSITNPAYPVMLHCPLNIGPQDYSMVMRGRYWIWPEHTPTMIARLVALDSTYPPRR